jgi:glycosyltransferase involved in cell wall biosynthesis
MTKISAIILTFNEEENIQEVIDTVSFADEIIIVDSLSKDKTKIIALENKNVKFFENKFENYTAQRNHALQLATHDWILFLDADERIIPQLKEEILKSVNCNEFVAYNFYRKFYYKRKPIHFSGTQTDKRICLFRKSKAKYSSKKLVHETLDIDGKTGFLKEKLIHYSFDSFEDYKNKMIFYGQLKAKELFQNGKKYSIWKHYSKTIFKFFKTYILRLGIFDCYNGLIVCYLQTLSVYITYSELKKISK